jgi:hypothetical protein
MKGITEYITESNGHKISSKTVYDAFHGFMDTGDGQDGFLNEADEAARRAGYDNVSCTFEDDESYRCKFVMTEKNGFNKKYEFRAELVFNFGYKDELQGTLNMRYEDMKKSVDMFLTKCLGFSHDEYEGKTLYVMKKPDR